MTEPEDRTRKAVRECAEWLAACLGFGWRHADLDFLEELWWKGHDNAGRLRPFSREPQEGKTP